MAGDAVDKSIHVELPSDAMSATIVIEPGLDPALVTVEVCEAVLSDRKVVITGEVKKAIVSLVKAYTDNPEVEARSQVATGSAPVHGEDERIEFEAGLVPLEDDSEASTVSHYDRSSFKTVSSGQRLGKLIPATEGSDGQTVLGKVLSAKAGRSLGLRTEESVTLSGDGVIVANVDGLLCYRDNLLRILTILEVPEYVDFSTGNIDFGGDVEIRRGVRDCFIVTATGSITVRGLVEAATIRAGLDVRLEGGMAAREKGVIEAGRDLHARYLDSVKGTIGRNVEVMKELVNSRLNVCGEMRSGRCAIIGGRLVVSGACDVGIVGAGGGSPTELLVGRIAEVDELRDVCRKLHPKVEARLTRFRGEFETLVNCAGKLSPSQAERMTELQYEVGTLEGLIQKLEEAGQRLDDLQNKYAEVDLSIQTRVHQGAKLVLRDMVVEFKDDLKGPFRLTLDKRGEPVMTDLIRDTPVEVRTVARVYPYVEDQEQNEAGQSSRAA
ncbi:MAG: DUF342 domain-containing protein [Phycisphaeraceae bacterium]|nr:MAG: DUF342 domain-containing protein [Phycisphaeraceae bacterium]